MSVTDILEETGCLRFISEPAENILKELKTSGPDASGIITEEAWSDLRKSNEERLPALYIHPLMTHIRKGMSMYDPVGIMLGRTDKDALPKAAGDVLREAGKNGGTEVWLTSQYPLIAEYRKSVTVNTVSAFREFVERLIDCRDEISELLPEAIDALCRKGSSS